VFLDDIRAPVRIAAAKSVKLLNVKGTKGAQFGLSNEVGCKLSFR